MSGKSNTNEGQPLKFGDLINYMGKTWVIDKVEVNTQASASLGGEISYLVLPLEYQDPDEYDALMKSNQYDQVCKRLHPSDFMKVESLEQIILSAAAKASAARPAPDKNPKEYTFVPSDYEEAKGYMEKSGVSASDWNNSGYACYLEIGDNGEIYYDLHLTNPPATIMYGETVEILKEDDHRVSLRIPNDDNTITALSKSFFEKNFAPSAICSREKNDLSKSSEPVR